MSFNLSSYSEEQQAPILHNGSPALIIAGAGTGKTTTLTGRIARLIQDGANPERMVLMTFTNKAAKHMRDKAASLMPGAELIVGGTFHSVLFRLLHEYGFAEGIYKGQRVFGDYQMARLWEKSFQQVFAEKERGLLKQLNLGGLPKLKSWYSKRQTGGLDTAAVEALPGVANWHAFRPDSVHRVFEVYEGMKREFDGLDFDDILVKFNAMLQVPWIRKKVQARFDYFFVDEYQDTSRLQAQVLRMWADGNPNVTVVGDPNQSIYSFLSADIGNILRFKDEFPGTRLFRLSGNYRSHQKVLNIANHILANSHETIFNPLTAAKKGIEQTEVMPVVHKYGSDRAESDGVVRDVQELLKTFPPKEVAILSRQSFTTYTTEMALTAAGIKYVKYGGLKVTAKKNIRQFLAFVELAMNKYNWLAWEVLLPMIPLIGDELAQRIVNDLSYRTDWVWSRPPPLSIGSGKRWHNFKAFWELLARTAELQETNAGTFMQRAFELFKPVYYFYWSNASSKEREAVMSEDMFDVEYQVSESVADPDSAYNQEAKNAVAGNTASVDDSKLQADAKLAEIEQYIVRFAEHRQDELKTFLSQFALDDSLEEKSPDDAIVISTIHSAKGLEWEAVFLLGLEEGTLPPAPRKYGVVKDAELLNDYPSIVPITENPYIEEERRLFYVAVTRAKRLLHLCYASQRMGKGFKDSNFLRPFKPAGALTGGTQRLQYNDFTYEKMRPDFEPPQRSASKPKSETSKQDTFF